MNTEQTRGNIFTKNNSLKPGLQNCKVYNQSIIVNNEMIIAKIDDDDNKIKIKIILIMKIIITRSR